MKKHVTQFISQCPTCQKQSVKKVAYNTIPFVTSSTKPHDRINVDTFQVSTDDAQGNKAVIVVVDTCTRWTELYPVPSWEQEFVGMSLLQHFGRYGPPVEILTDKGSEYLNETIKQFLKSQFVKQTNTPIAHSHEQNSRVERVNKELKRHLVNYCQENRIRSNWTRAIPAVQYIINITVNSQTGYSPFDLLFGPAVNPKRFNMNPLTTTEMDEEKFTEWFATQQQIHATIMDKAQELQESLDEQHLLERTLVPSVYAIGSYVLVSYPDTLHNKGQPPTKLMTIKKGPMKILERHGDKYEVLDLVSRKSEGIHISRIYPFLYDDTRVDPEKIAYRDKEEFEVEQILDDTIDLTLSVKFWRFLVKWTGYEVTEALWLPWDEIKHVGVLHDYLRNKGLGQYLPLSHQRPEDKKRRKQTILQSSNKKQRLK